MPYPVNPLVAAAIEPPVAEAQGWIAGRTFPADRPLLDCAQAVPSYPPAGPLREHLAEIVRRPETSLYTDILGLPELRAAFATAFAKVTLEKPRASRGESVEIFLLGVGKKG